MKYLNPFLKKQYLKKKHMSALKFDFGKNADDQQYSGSDLAARYKA